MRCIEGPGMQHLPLITTDFIPHQYLRVIQLNHIIQSFLVLYILIFWTIVMCFRTESGTESSMGWYMMMISSYVGLKAQQGNYSLLLFQTFPLEAVSLFNNRISFCRLTAFFSAFFSAFSPSSSRFFICHMHRYTITTYGEMHPFHLFFQWWEVVEVLILLMHFYNRSRRYSNGLFLDWQIRISSP